MTKTVLKNQIDNWLLAWQKAIASKDFDAGRKLFRDDAAGFGTVSLYTEGLDDLVESQWRPVWSRTAKFTFEKNKQHHRFSADKTQCIVTSLWRSEGGEEGGPVRLRRGRATILLEWHEPQSAWLCVHTHFSMWPGSADIDILSKMSGACCDVK